MYLFSILSILLFFCSRSRDFSLTRESNSLSDYRPVRLLSLEPCLFLYCPHSTVLYLPSCNSLVSAFILLMDPVSGTFAGFGFSLILLSGSGGIAVQFLFTLFSSRSMSGFLFPHAGFSVFFVSYAYFGLRCLVFVPPSFIHAESVHEFALLACCYSRWVF